MLITGITDIDEIDESVKNEILSTALEQLNRNYDMIACHLDEDDEQIWIVEGWNTIREFRDIIKEMIPNLDEILPERNYDYPAILDTFCERWSFADEYQICSQCNRAVYKNVYNSYPDCFVDYDHCEVLCGDCVRSNPESYFEHIINNSDTLNHLLDNAMLSAAGFKLYKPDFANGWYGFRDKPAEIMAKAQEENPDMDFLFNSSYVNPFETGFELWARKKEE